MTLQGAVSVGDRLVFRLDRSHRRRVWYRLHLSSVIILGYEPGSAITPEAINASTHRTAGSHTAVLR